MPKGYKQLSEADVFIYAGSFDNPDLLNYCGEGAEIHDSQHVLMEIIDAAEAGVKAGKDVSACRLRFLHLWLQSRSKR